MDKRRALEKNIEIVYKFCHSNKIYSYIYEGFEDFISEMVLEAFQKIERWEPKRGALSTFLHTILKNRIYTDRREYHKKEVEIIPLYELDNEPDIIRESLDETFEQKEEQRKRAIVAHILRNSLLYKKYYLDEKMTNLADQYNCSRQRLYDALSRERAEILEKFPTEESFLEKIK